MLKALMHSIIGQNPMANLSQSQAKVSVGPVSRSGALLGAEKSIPRSSSRKVFSGNIEVSQVANGYVVNIATREGYEYETYIAQTAAEVNEIIAAAMVAFQLEK